MRAVNKQGQAIGRKGLESRARMAEAALALLAEDPARPITASAVARAAGLASQTFYLYFEDVEELLLLLSEEASADTADILAALDGEWDPSSLQRRSREFIEAFSRYWRQHRAVLNIRNFRADNGDRPFLDLRTRTAMPIVTRIAQLIRVTQGSSLAVEADALARSVIIYAAIERLAARPANGAVDPELLSAADIQRAEADILTLLFTPPPPATGA